MLKPSFNESKYTLDQLTFRLLGNHCMVHSDYIADPMGLVDESRPTLHLYSMYRMGCIIRVLSFSGTYIQLDFNKYQDKEEYLKLLEKLEIKPSGFTTLNQFLNFLVNGGYRSVGHWRKLSQLMDDNETFVQVFLE